MKSLLIFILIYSSLSLILKCISYYIHVIKYLDNKIKKPTKHYMDWIIAYIILISIDITILYNYNH